MCGFAVLRVKARGQRELVTVLSSLPSVSAVGAAYRGIFGIDDCVEAGQRLFPLTRSRFKQTKTVAKTDDLHRIGRESAYRSGSLGTFRYSHHRRHDSRHKP